MEAEAAKLIGAGIAVLPLLGVGLGIGNIFSSLITSIARNPAARGEVCQKDGKNDSKCGQGLFTT